MGDTDALLVGIVLAYLVLYVAVRWSERGELDPF